ncbi:MAG TPA: DUF3048 domain-containing protein [Anaerolineales bacterium]|jgi:hypothetical protein
MRRSKDGHFSSLRVTILHLILLLFFTTACAAFSNPIPVSINLATATPTPFQPQPGAPDSPFAAPALPLPAPTFTAVPTVRVNHSQLSVQPEILAPAIGGGGFVPGYLTNPLTGLAFADPALAERRPMAIKITNSPDYVRPQSGLTLADVVYEYYIEWGDTRFIAVFYGNDAKMVGPVRSGRFFDEHILRMYQAFLVYKYSDPREKEYFYSSDFASFLVVPGFTACPPFLVGKYARDSYNNIFFNTTKFGACLAKAGRENARPSLRSGFFSEQVTDSALQVNRIYTHYSAYSYNYWEYDAATHKYFRFQEAHDEYDPAHERHFPASYAALSDALTGLPVTADNVIEIFVPYVFTDENQAEDQVYHIDLVDSGQAFVFRDGFAYPARWYRTDNDQPLLITSLNGTPIYLRPGHTFYEVIGESSTYVQDGADWSFRFQTP